MASQTASFRGTRYYSSLKQKGPLMILHNRFHRGKGQRLELKRQPWKVTKVDITTTNYQEASMALRDEHL